MPEIIDIHPNSPTQQPSSPRTHWTKEVKAFQLNEFAVTVVYWLCGNHYDGKLHIEIMNFRVTWYDSDLGQPEERVLNEIMRDLLEDYYSQKITFE